MSAELMSIVERERQFSRLGSVSRSGVRFVPHILERAREQWPEAKRSGGDELARLSRKVAYGMGGIAHYPADFILKSLMSRLAGADWNATHHQMQTGTASREATDAIQEISVYYDLKVFREVYLSGAEEPFNRFVFSRSDSPAAQALEEFVTSLFQRALLASHTLAPDTKDLDAWLDNLISHVQPLYLNIERYVDVFQHPDGEKTRRYGVETEFYRADDPVIAIARAVQAGGSAGAAQIDSAIADNANKSGYAKAVALGVRCYRQASDFWEHRSDTVPDVSQG